MDSKKATQSHSLEQKLWMIVVVLLMIFIPLFFASSLSSSACSKEMRDFERKLRFCNFTLNFKGGSYGKRRTLSRPYFHRAIALSELEQQDAAKEDMRQALFIASDGRDWKRFDRSQTRSYYVMDLNDQIREHPELLNANKNWDAVLEDLFIDFD
ncbi:hypothetical protein ROA7450_00100 [Roseovarius albus]|uniref:Tetratricopeptide repeat protein n=1 Tax=Roseovarius albus TaxID=1247867 RepID=A0A1X6Y5U1_9RHOB|nr:hypothetical protein [Roseovarius albus]SLN11585.1 hypothetical protein ROA7450_00100 [Roseovarius albus]